MSYLLPHLDSGWAVDQAILTEEAKVVVIRFGRDADPVWCVRSSRSRSLRRNTSYATMESACSMQMDETLSDISDDVKNFAVIYLVDVSEVPDFVSVHSNDQAK